MKKIKMKKIFLGIMIGINCIFLLVGCGSTPDNNKETENITLYLIESVSTFDKNNSITNIQKKEYDDEGNLLRQTNFDADENVTSWDAFVYDANLNIIKSESFFRNEDGSSEIHCYEYKYNDRNQMILQTSSINGTPWTKTVYDLYDSNGNLIKESSYDVLIGDGSNMFSWTIHEYDSDGFCIKSITYDAAGKINSEIANNRTSTGYSNVHIYYNNDGNIYHKKETVYNSFDDLTDFIYTDSKGEVINEGHYDYQYNDNGDIILLNEYDAVGGERVYYSKYEYDDRGNVIEINTYNDNEELIQYQKIDYVEFRITN